MCNCSLTAAKVDDERSVEMFVPNERCMHAGTRRVVNTEVAHMFVTAEKITFLFVDH